VFARQPCYHVQAFLDVGQWLCVPHFRVVCLYQASNSCFLTLPIPFTAIVKSCKQGRAIGVPWRGEWRPAQLRYSVSRELDGNNADVELWELSYSSDD
jgi:hypothetical protein